MHLRDERVAALAAAQHGSFSDDQVHDAGFSDRTVRYRVASGAWRRLGPNSLRAANAPVTWFMRLQAGLLDLGPEAVVARRAAAKLLGLEGIPGDPVEFAVPRARRDRLTAGVVHSTTHLTLIDRCVVGGFPTTTATRTIIDLAADVNEVTLGDLADSAVRLGWTSPDFLGRRLQALRGPGRHGAPLIDRLLKDSGGHSRLERAFLALVRRAGYQRPRTQVVYAPGGEFVARVDFLFDPDDVIVEVKGRWFHDLPGRFERETQRHAELTATGKRLLPFTYRQVFERPGWVLEQLGLTLGRAA